MQWLMLQQEKAKDYVISSGRNTSVRSFIEACGKKLGWSKNDKEPAIIWEGIGLEEVGKRADNGEIIIRIDPSYFRPNEVDQLLGDSKKAREELGWSPKISLNTLITEMIKYDEIEAKKESLLKKQGFKLNTSLETIHQIMKEQ